VRRHRKSEGFNLAFLDIMSCGLGAVVLVFMLVKHNVGSSTTENDLLAGDVQRLELQQAELQQTLEQLLNISQSEAEKIAQLKARLAQLEQSLAQKQLSLAQKKNRLAALKNDIAKRPIAQKEDLIEDDRGGEENYLMGLKVEGRRIAVLVDSSASMTDEKLLNIIKRKNGSAASKKKGPKWLRTRKIVRWLLARVPKTSQLTVVSYNGSVKSLGSGRGSWQIADNPASLQALYRDLDTIVPEGATNLQKGLQAVSGRRVTDLYVITDGLPTVGESRYASLNPFASCSSLLGKSSTISGECRVKLFRQTIKDSKLAGIKVNVILLPIEGDPDAANEYWGWAALSGGLMISPAVNWP
jgi:outer membrane murein-binding lipoprotein Lpp